MINVLVVDDHTIFREGIKLILNTTDSYRVTAEAGDGKEALNLLCKNDYDVILLDIAMPGRNGLEVLKDIKKLKPEQHVLMLSMYSEKQFALRAMKIGASGYVAKASASTELLEALAKVSAGRMHVNASVANQLIFELRNDRPEQDHERLSTRELQVMEMIVSGKRNKEIANELSLGISTVSTHRSQILKKLNLKNNAEIIQYALEHNLFYRNN